MENPFGAFLLSAALWAAVLGVPGQAAVAAPCDACHDQPREIAGTVHAVISCLDCHPGYEEVPHPYGIPSPACAECHEDVAARTAMGVHGPAAARGDEDAPGCTTCHGDVHRVEKTGTWAFRGAVPGICGMCHGAVLAEFEESEHGKAVARGIVDAPVCSTCHREHMIRPPAAALVPQVCGRCHGDVLLVERYNLPRMTITSFERSVHGLSLRAGSQTVANCASCHGVHLILPSSDPRSLIHPDNLSETCGACHPGAGTRFEIGSVHWGEGAPPPWPVRLVRSVYLVLIPLVLGAMALHNLGDWVRKAKRLRLAGAPTGKTPGGPSPPGAGRGRSFLPPRPEPGNPSGESPGGTGSPPPEPGRDAAPGGLETRFRMYRFERIEHALLLVSFTILVWTGFALVYSDQWWARPLVALEPRWPVRGLVHRIAGAVLIGLSVLHVASLFASGTLRRHWTSLLPRQRDIPEATGAFLYNLGVRRTPPKASFHSYVEKVEYWAVVWGTALMGATGVMLWANTFMLARFPKVVLDVALAFHFYEAVLATLAIVVWHFYFVIFDPDVYPMDPAWITGYSVREREADDDDPATEAGGARLAGDGPEGNRGGPEGKRDGPER
jgi:cytochrome b subunit of formate dehydrogenase